MMTRSTRRSWGGDDMLGVIGEWSKVLCWGMSRFLCGDQRVFKERLFLFHTFAGGTVLAGVGSFSRSLSFSAALRLRLRGRD